jgi:methylmalonyl-CoA/ethylmalonyl-CoA epimerase
MNAELEQTPGFLFFDHVAISVKPGELESHVKAYNAMGFREVHREDVLGSDQVREVLLQVGEGPNLVQLLEPLSPESPVAKQLEKNGGRGGLAHVALRVADIGKAFDYLKENGFRIIDHAPRKGSRGTTVFFLHPKTTEAAAFGYLIEVVQEGAHA